MINKKTSKLKRPIYQMPAFVKKALLESGMMRMYEGRPDYQQNDYVGWILRAALEQTKQKRLSQMLSELKKGDVYMKMKYKPKK